MVSRYDREFQSPITNVATEECGHTEVAGAAITTILTSADARDVGEPANPHRVLKPGKGVLAAYSSGALRTADCMFCSGDLVEDLAHNYLLERGARNGRLNVYRTVDDPARQVGYARVPELMTDADLTTAFSNHPIFVMFGSQPSCAGSRSLTTRPVN
jgi:Mn-containing catalase